MARALANAPQPHREIRWAGSAPHRSGPPSLKKAAILQAAATLFREHGYERTRLDDVARVLNVTKPALYYYFRNKEEILVAIQQAGFNEIMAELKMLSRGAHTGREILRGVIVRYTNWVASEAGMCVVRHFLLELSAANLARIRKARRTMEHSIRATIVRGIEDGSLRPCDPWIVATSICGAVNWTAFWYEPGAGRRSATEIGEAYFNLLIDGISAAAQPPLRSRAG